MTAVLQFLSRSAAAGGLAGYSGRLASNQPAPLLSGIAPYTTRPSEIKEIPEADKRSAVDRRFFEPLGHQV